jgi:hypothetical protein
MDAGLKKKPPNIMVAFSCGSMGTVLLLPKKQENRPHASRNVAKQYNLLQFIYNSIILVFSTLQLL